MRSIYQPIKKAFTLLEMIIVMVVLGIIANFGVEILVNAYSNYIFTSVQNRLQSQSEAAVNQIANRLEYRIKDSAIARTTSGDPVVLAQAAEGMDTGVLEWVSADREGWLGATNVPLWSGFIDVNNPAAAVNRLITPQSNLAALDALIGNISPTGSGVADAAIYFLGGSGDALNGFGWSGAIAAQNQLLHPINQTAGGNFTSSIAGVNFANVDIFEFYQLAWTAYAVAFENGNLVLYYDYQPWLGETARANGTREVLMQNVTTFAFKSEDGVISIQVCVSDTGLSDAEAYSVCKEKTIL
ncbi:MAG: protein containing prepilin-type N- cleavage/methylation domain protein [Sulfurimonas sp.]|nr:MAG: protein containing prepilin-type N- cleavage/methylation domain protein [Sulfurimonas sp.]